MNLRVPFRPLRIDIDPEFDVFRKLDRHEIPPALTQAFGAKKVLIILPGESTSETILGRYRELSRSWNRFGPQEVEIKLDSDVAELPADHGVAILGWNNRFLDEIATALSGYDINIGRAGVRIKTTEMDRKKHSVVLTARHPKNQDVALTWVASDVAGAFPGLARKLPHYHKYSYLGFKGEQPLNILKGRWPVINSPMTVFVPREDGTVAKVKMGNLVPREPLATLPPVFSANRIKTPAAKKPFTPSTICGLLP